MKLRILPATRASAVGLLTSLVLAACGGGGGFDEPAATPGPSPSNANERVLSSFESGASGFVALTAGGSPSPGAATLAAVAQHATTGTGSLRVTLNEADAMVGLTTLDSANANWTGYRSLLVDVYSSAAVDAAAPLLVTKSGSGYTWCTMAPAQAVTAGSTTTLSFRLDWAAMTCAGTGADKADVKEMYIKVGAAAGAEYYIDNIRLTRAVRVLPLGDSITGSPGCWRKTLWDSLQTANSTAVDMVGVRNNAGDCGTGWDGDNAGFGGMRVTTIGGNVGLAAAGRTDTVFVSSGVTPVPGNLAVWLEQSRPEMVMLNLGTNDLWSGVSASTILAGYDTLIAQMRASNPKMHILVAQIPLFAPDGCTTDCPTRAAAFNTALASWAACARTAVSPIAVVNLADGWNAATMTDDGVHPNTAGVAQMATNWFTPVRDGLDGIDTNGSGPDSSCGGPALTDIADATASTDGNTFTISSFRAGLGSFKALTNAGVDATSDQATVALDATGHATDGIQAAAVVVVAPPAAGWIGFANSSNGGLADWSGYRYLRFDVTTASAELNASLAVQSGADWSKWCQSPAQTVAAGSTGTFVLDLSTCGTDIDLTTVQRHQLAISSASGTFYVDNVRLERGSAAPTDIADATVVSATTTQLYSFASSVAGLGEVRDTSATDNSALATVTLQANSSFATDGENATQIVVGSADALIGITPPSVTNWTGFRHLRVDMAATGGVWWAQLVVQSGPDWHWCDLGQTGPSVVGDAATGITTMATVSFDLTALNCASGSSYTPGTIQRYMLLVQSTSGTYHIDNLRLTTD